MEDKSNAAGNTAVESKETVSGTPGKKASKTKATKIAKNTKAKASHPKTSDMVNQAIKELKDRKGSSFQAIKKYIASTYKVDGEKLAPFIKRYLKAAVTSGAVVQTKGKGASGSFKLSADNKKCSDSKTKAPKSPKPVAEAKKQKKSVEKKTTTATPVRKPAAKGRPSRSPAKKIVEAAKKPAAAKRRAPPKSAEKITVKKVAAESKTISKCKKTAKAPAAKTRTPKPKKAAATSKAVKAAAKK